MPRSPLWHLTARPATPQLYPRQGSPRPVSRYRQQASNQSRHQLPDTRSCQMAKCNSVRYASDPPQSAPRRISTAHTRGDSHARHSEEGQTVVSRRLISFPLPAITQHNPLPPSRSKCRSSSAPRQKYCSPRLGRAFREPPCRAQFLVLSSEKRCDGFTRPSERSGLDRMPRGSAPSASRLESGDRHAPDLPPIEARRWRAVRRVGRGQVPTAAVGLEKYRLVIGSRRSIRPIRLKTTPCHVREPETRSGTTPNT